MANVLRPIVFVLGTIAVLLLLPLKPLEVARQHIRYIVKALIGGRPGLALQWLFNLFIQLLVYQTFGNLCVYGGGSVYLLLIGNYGGALGFSIAGSLHYLLLPLLVLVPWPHGENAKLVAFGRVGKVGTVRQLSRMREQVRPTQPRSQLTRRLSGPLSTSRSAQHKPHERSNSEEEVSRRRRAQDAKDQHLLTYTSMGKGGSIFDKGCEHVLRDSLDQGADVGTEDEFHWTVLMNAARHGYWHTFKLAYQHMKLLEKGTLNVTASDNGESALHLALDPSQQLKMKLRFLLFADTRPVPTAEYVKVLLGDGRVDPCATRFDGRTPYMVAALPAKIECMRPEPSWASVEKALGSKAEIEMISDELDGRANALLALIAGKDSCGKPWPCSRLRLHDMLFCRHEGPEAVLEQRRALLFHRFLGPFTQYVCTKRELDKREKEMLIHAWSASVSSTQLGHYVDGRAGYKQEFRATMVATMAAFSAQLEPVRTALKADEAGGGSRLCAELGVGFFDVREKGQHLTHLAAVEGEGNLMAVPKWALEGDVSGAARALQRIGVLNTPACFCLLISRGENALLGPRPAPQYFAEHRSLDFWLALVTLYLLGLHQLMQPRFKMAMESVAGEGELALAPMKQFPRTMAKAREYIAEKKLEGWKAQVSAPFHVIDILRCTFTTPSPRRNLEISQAIIATECAEPTAVAAEGKESLQLQLIRSKNGHRTNDGMGGYADRKLNVAMTAPTSAGEVTVIVEVQILLTDYAQVKKRMHACYRAARGDFGELVPPLT